MGPVWAQFAQLPAPVPPAGKTSEAGSDVEYRIDAARHVYASYPNRIYKGRLPPLLYGVAIVETDVDAEGKVLEVRVLRPPAAAEVGPWIVQMIQRSGPFPVPAKMGRATYKDIWLVDKGGQFQLDTLTEGQR
ncbi:MAG: hypothetical protein ACKVQR_03405 [Aquabacterium sp.]